MRKLLRIVVLLSTLVVVGVCGSACGGPQTTAQPTERPTQTLTTPPPATANPTVAPTAAPTTAPPLTPAPSPQPSGDGVVDGWAVLAERDYYSEYGMADLPVDYVNVERVHQLLLDLGWEEGHIREVREFDQDGLRDALDWMASSADADDLVFLHVSAHGQFLHEGVSWTTFFPPEWAAIPSQRRVVVVNSCRAAIFTGAVRGDPEPYLSIASTGREEGGWAGLEEEGLPIIGEVFTYYFVAAFTDPEADADGDGTVSIQEAADYGEEKQCAYMHEVVFAVPEFEQAFRDAGFRIDDPAYPHVAVDDKVGEPVYLELGEP